MTETVREQTPVIVAVGETIDRPDQLEDAKEPVDLMVEALRACEEDAGARLIESLNRIDVIGVVSWLYENPAALLCERLGLDPARGRTRGMGGEKPIRLIDEAARAVAAGEQEMIAVVGGEAMNSYRKARRADVRLDWTPRADRMAAWGDLDDTTLGVPEAVQKLGVQRPIHVYPFFENALQAKRGQTPTEGMCKSAELWARFSDAAAQNPYAWRRDALSARDIATITDENRMVSFPYVKFMAANDSVNQAGAVIVCSLAAARRLGVPDQRLIFFRDAAAANEPANFLKRARFDACPAMETTLETLARRADGGGAFDLIELYSCFPVVPKMARRILCAEGMKTDAPPSVVGGLTFLGGPLNNYMTHPAGAMVRKQRPVASQ